MSFHLIEEVLLNTILITGIVITMMLMIEYINIQSQGKWFARLQKSRTGQVLLGSILGLIPGCVGGFAAVSLYTHGLIGFGALIAMMIASSGDEAFVMMAAIPKDALILFGVLFIISIIVGLIINLFTKEKAPKVTCTEEFIVHEIDHHHHDEHGHCDENADCPHASFKNLRHASWQRIVLLLGVGLFTVALAFGLLGHEHEHGLEEASHSHINLLDEYWINLIFAILSLFVLYFIATAKEHFIKEHLWHHVIKRHFLSIFLWTLGSLAVIEIGLSYLDLESLVSENIPVMILLAVLIGIIPESGPHMIFITLFASGLAPFSVLLASSISQDGHASIPLLAESKSAFIKAKLVNVVVALIVGYATFYIC